jgi:hypothetical protein
VKHKPNKTKQENIQCKDIINANQCYSDVYSSLGFDCWVIDGRCSNTNECEVKNSDEICQNGCKHFENEINSS